MFFWFLSQPLLIFKIQLTNIACCPCRTEESGRFLHPCCQIGWLTTKWNSRGPDGFFNPPVNVCVCEHVDTHTNVCIHIMKNKINLLKETSVHTQSWKSWIWYTCFCDLQFHFSRLFYYILLDWLNFLSTFILCVTFKAGSKILTPVKFICVSLRTLKICTVNLKNERMHFYIERLFYISSSFKVIF